MNCFSLLCDETVLSNVLFLTYHNSFQVLPFVVVVRFVSVVMPVTMVISICTPLIH